MVCPSASPLAHHAPHPSSTRCPLEARRVHLEVKRHLGKAFCFIRGKPHHAFPSLGRRQDFCHEGSLECFPQFVADLLEWISLLDLIWPPPSHLPRAFALLKPFSTFVNLSDIEKNRHPVNTESCNPGDVYHSFNWDGLVASQMFPFSRYHCVLKLWIIIAL